MWMGDSGGAGTESGAPTVFEFETTDDSVIAVAPEPRSAGRRRWRRPVLGPPLAWVRGWGRRTVETPIRERDPRAAVSRRDAIFRRSLACADLLAATLAVLVSVIGFGDGLEPLALLSLPLVVVVGKLGGVYD